MTTQTPDHGKRYCGAKKRQGEGSCTRPAGWGTDHAGEGSCKLHGGSTPTVSKGALDRLHERQVREMADTYGLPVDTTPEQAILDEVRRTAGHVRWLEEQVHALTRGELTWGITKVKEGGDDAGVTEEAVPHALLRLYQAERAHLVKVCAEAIRCGIEERRVRLAESQGNLVAEALRRILEDLRLSPEQQARVAQVVPQRLRELTAATN